MFYLHTGTQLTQLIHKLDSAHSNYNINTEGGVDPETCLMPD